MADWINTTTKIQNATKAHDRFHDYPYKLMKMKYSLVIKNY